MLQKKQANPIDRHVGTRVRMRRMMLGKSQEWLGGEIGVTFQQVQKYEKGANRAGASRLQQIAEALQVPVSFFFEGQPGRGTGETPTIGAQDLLAAFFTIPGAGELAQHFTAIESGPERRILVDMAAALAGRLAAYAKAAE